METTEIIDALRGLVEAIEVTNKVSIENGRGKIISPYMSVKMARAKSIILISFTGDLFKSYELLPRKIQEIVTSFDDNNDLYKECERLLAELKPHGYEFDYGLDGVPYDLRIIKA